MPDHGSRTLLTICDNALMPKGFPQHCIALDLALQCERFVVSGIATEIKTC